MFRVTTVHSVVHVTCPKRSVVTFPIRWILRLLDESDDVEIRSGILDLIGELFVSRPLEYRTWYGMS